MSKKKRTLSQKPEHWEPPLMTEKQAEAIAAKAIMSQMVVAMPNPIQFEWTKIVAHEFMRRYNKVAYEGFLAWIKCNGEWSRPNEEEMDNDRVVKFFKDNLSVSEVRHDA